MPLAAVTAVLEAVGAVSLYALIRVIGDPAAARRLPVVSTLVAPIATVTDRTLVLAFAVLLAVFYLAKNGLQVWQAWTQSARAADARAEISGRALARYLGAPWTFHLRRNSAELIRNVTGTVEAVVRRVLAPSVMLAAEGLVVGAIAAVLVLASPGVTLALVLVVGGVGAAVLRVTRRWAGRWGEETHQLEREVIQGVQQTLGAVKEIRVLGRERFFFDAFTQRQTALVRLRHLSDTLAFVPRVLVEAVFVLGALGLVAIVVGLGGSGTRVVPLLGLYAYAGFRVIPSANRIIMYVNEVRAGAAAVATLHRDLADVPPVADAAVEPLAFADTIRFAGVSFTYEGAAQPALADVELAIRRGESVGIVGSTGAGKSTLVDVLIGLLTPTAGAVLADGRDLREHARAWQRAIGYVPQTVVLVDDTLARNVALGVPDAAIDRGRLADALRMAQLDEVVAALPDGLATRVGERGVRLSGGQRQRVGIARALYHGPRVLVFDEATSALDNRTEAEVLRAIEALRGTLTLVVVAHRLTSVAPCDRLVFLDAGRVAGAGTYDALLRDNAEFRRMAAAPES